MEKRFKDLVDIFGGKMTLEKVVKEIIFYMSYKKPKRLIVDIQRKEKNGGYYTTIYMDKSSFEKR